MRNEEYINKIMEMINQIKDEATLRRIYLILVVITRADH